MEASWNSQPRISVLAIAAAAALGLSALPGAALAKPATAEAVLASNPQQTKQIIDGRSWKCLGTGCRGISGGAPKSQPIVFECRAVAASFGPLVSYKSGRTTLNAEQLARCNEAAPAGALAGGGAAAQAR